QLASRYAATYGFFIAGLLRACERLRSYAESAHTGTLEEPATARALAGFLLRGLDCGAISEADISERCGLDRAVLSALRAAGPSPKKQPEANSRFADGALSPPFAMRRSRAPYEFHAPLVSAKLADQRGPASGQFRWVGGSAKRHRAIGDVGRASRHR